MILADYWLLFLSIFILISLKQFLLWMYLWQKKEYRGDKMWDYFSLEESKNIVFDKWTKLRIGYLAFFLGLSILANFYWENWLASVFNFTTLVFLGLNIVESLEFVAKIVTRKNILRPGLSAKMLLHSGLTTGSFVIIFGTFLTSNFSLNIFLATLVILLIPIIIGYWLLVMFPFDYYFKNKVFLRAKNHRQKLDKLKVIAVSGAYGKTSTKEILDQILGIKFSVEKTLKNQNSNVSCARKTLKLNSETDIFICELGSYKTGDGNEIANFILPNCSIITGLNFQHYSLFGSKQNIILAESESLKFLPKKSPVAINWSSSMCRDIPVPAGLEVIKYGVPKSKQEAKEFDIYATSIKLTSRLTTEFELFYDGKTQKLETNLLSSGNIENLVGVIALALHFKVPLSKIKTKILDLKPAHGALEISKQNNYYQIDDSYNANFDGIKNAIELLFEMKKNKELKIPKSIVFIDDILELGQKSIEIHQNLGKIIADKKIDIVVLLGRNFAKTIYQTLSQEGFDINKVWFWDNRNTAEIKQHLSQYLEQYPDSVALFEGYQSRKFL